MSKLKIPKRVAGVKIPKKVRKKAKKALKLAESPALQKAAVAALGAAASAKAARDAAGDDKPRRGGSGRVDVDTLKDALRTAALDGIRRFMEGFDEEMRKASAAADAARAADERPERPNGGRASSRAAAPRAD